MNNENNVIDELNTEIKLLSETNKSLKALLDYQEKKYSFLLSEYKQLLKALEGIE